MVNWSSSSSREKIMNAFVLLPKLSSAAAVSKCVLIGWLLICSVASAADETHSSSDASPTPDASLAPSGTSIDAPFERAQPPQVEIESQFIETTDTALRRLKPGGAGVAVLQKTLRPEGNEVILSPEEAAEIRQASSKLRGRLELLSAPRVTTRSGQRAVIEIIREFRYASEWKRDEEKQLWAPAAWETRNCGVTLEVEPSVSDDGSISLVTTPQVVQFLGWRDPDSGKILSVKRAGRLLDWKNVPGPDTTTPGTKFGKQRLLPVFSARKIETKVTLQPGEALLVGALQETEEVHTLKSPASSRRLIAVISARLIHPNGNPQQPFTGSPERTTSKPDTQGAVDKLLFGAGTTKAAAQKGGTTAVAGAHPVGTIRAGDRPGFVRSPFAVESGTIDVRGYPSGTEVKDPYSGKIFLVP
jgi:hypothetical protein